MRLQPEASAQQTRQRQRPRRHRKHRAEYGIDRPVAPRTPRRSEREPSRPRIADHWRTPGGNTRVASPSRASAGSLRGLPTAPGRGRSPRARSRPVHHKRRGPGQDENCHRRLRPPQAPSTIFPDARCPPRKAGEKSSTPFARSLPSARPRPIGMTKPVLRRLRTPSGSGGWGTSATACWHRCGPAAGPMVGPRGKTDRRRARGSPRHGTCPPSRRRAELVAHVERRLKRRDTIEVAERALRMPRGYDMAERRKPAQAFRHDARSRSSSSSNAHVYATPQEAGAGPFPPYSSTPAALGCRPSPAPIAADKPHAGRERLRRQARKRPQAMYAPRHLGEEG